MVLADLALRCSHFLRASTDLLPWKYWDESALGRAILCLVFPRVSVNVEGLEGDLQGVLKPLFLPSVTAPSMYHFTIKQLLQDVLTIHPDYMASPSDLCSHQ